MYPAMQSHARNAFTSNLSCIFLSYHQYLGPGNVLVRMNLICPISAKWSFHSLERQKRYWTKFLSDTSTSLGKGVSGSLLRAKTQTSLARLTADLGTWLLLHYSSPDLKELKTRRTGRNVVSWCCCICKYTCLPFQTRCTQGFGQCGWLVANLQKILIFCQLQQSHSSSQASQMHRELTCVVWKAWISEGCRPVTSCAQKGTKMQRRGNSGSEDWS